MRQIGLALLMIVLPAAAQAQNAPVPDRVCTQADIDLALEGRYAGPPCRFEESMREETAVSRETVRLSDSFFSGSLAGGVERPARPLYSYRGLILIDGAGRVQYGRYSLGHRTGVVRAMDSTPYQPPRARYPVRVYPAD